MISPLLSNIYLHALDRAFADGAHGTLVRYADDFVVLCRSEPRPGRPSELAGEVLAGLGLELHPEKTRVVDLREGREGFDFLGCHFRARVSGRMLERGVRRYYLQRWPSQRAMKRIRARIKALTGRGRAGMDIRDVIAAINPILRGWGNYFRTGNAAIKFIQIDRYVEWTAARPDAQALWPQPATPASGRPGRASGSRPTASIACAAPFATRDSRRDHQEDHR